MKPSKSWFTVALLTLAMPASWGADDATQQVYTSRMQLKRSPGAFLCKTIGRTSRHPIRQPFSVGIKYRRTGRRRTT